MGTILVVDDEPPILSAVMEALRDEGHVVVSAADGLAAQAILAETPPDLVLTDVSMPRLGGCELVRWMRGRPTTRALPVILMSAMRAPNLASLGRVAFLEKPFDLDVLLTEVETALAEPPAQHRAAAAGAIVHIHQRR